MKWMSSGAARQRDRAPRGRDLAEGLEELHKRRLVLELA
jgi:hypothetical protein